MENKKIEMEKEFDFGLLYQSRIEFYLLYSCSRLIELRLQNKKSV